VTHRLLRAALPAALALLTAAPLAAQTPPRGPSAAAVRRAIETITAADFRRRVAVIADDSMRGRETPSPGLDKTAAYIAAEFRSFGLRPGGDGGTFLQRYPVRRTQVDSSAFMAAAGHGVSSRWAFGRDLALVRGTMPDSLSAAPAVLMVGLAADTARPFGDGDVRGAVIFQVLPFAAVTRQRQIMAVAAKGVAAGARAWVFLSDFPAPFFAGFTRGALAPQYEVPGLGGEQTTAHLVARDTSLADLLAAAGETLAAVRDTSAHRVRSLPGITVTISAPSRVTQETTAPNAVGVLEGRDPRLRDEYVLFTGHMDHVGDVASGRCTAAGADSICNGANDDASGTIGVVELAQAFAALSPRPRRSMVFVAVSGEERDFWGSEWFAEHPVRPLTQAVADLNLDMIARNWNDSATWRDSIAVLGKEHSSLGEAANRVSSEHPEVNMRLADDPEHGRYFMQSDHYPFAVRGVPYLFFFSGVHPGLHRPTDSVDAIDADKAARVLRAVFHLALDVADADARPQWLPEARSRIVRGAAH